MALRLLGIEPKTSYMEGKQSTLSSVPPSAGHPPSAHRTKTQAHKPDTWHQEKNLDEGNEKRKEL